MKRPNAKDIINSSMLIREPLDKSANNILNSSSKKIIIAGGRGIGKSTVLRYLENRGFGCNERTIYINPEAIQSFSSEPNERYNEEFFNYLYGLLFNRYILSHIKTNYHLIYEKYFKANYDLIVKLIDNVYNSCNIALFGYVQKMVIETKMDLNDYLKSILERFQTLLEIDKLNLAIDRYDEVNGSSKYVQKLYEEKFSMFNKVILSTNDPTINENDLHSKGYEINKLTYTKNEEVLKEIIKQYLLLNSTSYEQREKLKPFANDKIIQKLLSFDGNIKTCFDVLDEAIKIQEWSNSSKNYDEIISEAIKYENSEIVRHYKSPRNPKLYL